MQIKAETSMKKLILTTILSCALLSNAFAAGDAAAGKSKAAVCAACHGSNGIGLADMYPNLAGQQQDYLTKQLNAFKSGDRKDPLMSPMAANLSPEDMDDLSAYFASFTRSGESKAAPTTATSTPEPTATAVPVNEPLAPIANAANGKQIYIKGDLAKGIPACIGCHGEEGNSDVLINPNLAEQHPEYIEKQLHAFKSQTRMNPSMTVVAKNLTDDDIADLGAYFKDPKAMQAVATPTVAKRAEPKLSFIGDVAAGKAKSVTCAACHGADGNALVSIYPNLAGQHEQYIAKQLAEFKQGAEGRADPVMAGMVAGLSSEDMQDLAAYFASQKAKPTTAKANPIGKKLYQGGDTERGITACIACHGVSGNGMALAGFPKISNQSTDYLASQLKKFRDGTRHNDANSMMGNIAAKLTDKDIAAVVEYMSSLR